MRRLSVLLMIGLAACAGSDSGQRARGGGLTDVHGWRFASGKHPTRAEYAAVVAACQDGTVTRTRGRPFDSCLADLGLRRAP